MSFLEMRGVSKYFPGVNALNSVDFDAERGEVHAIAGENGAGKSTLIKILAGVYTPDEGVIFLEGKEIKIHNPYIGRKIGISVIYQELTLVPHLSIAENIFLGAMPNKMGIVNWRTMNKKARRALKDIGFDLDPTRLVKGLSVVQQQAVEIAKVLVEDLKIVVMDEPTALLPVKEVETLFRIINTLKEKGVTVLYISHRLQEIFEIADRVTVLKDGSKVATVKPSEINHEQLVRMMIGRKPSERIFWNPDKKQKLEKSPVLLEIDGLGFKNCFQDISFKLRQGEILGVAGLVGSGKSELIQSIFGGNIPDSGKVKVRDKKLLGTPSSSLKNRVGFLPSDRKSQGLILGMNLTQNITITDLKKFSKASVILTKFENKVVSELVKKLRIKTRSNFQIVRTLSGGNQQKVVIAKWLLPNCEILLFDEPTRGIDVGARTEIYEIMVEFVDKGGSIIIVSSDNQELLSICDRIFVMGRGSITTNLNREDATEEKIVQAMF